MRKKEKGKMEEDEKRKCTIYEEKGEKKWKKKSRRGELRLGAGDDGRGAVKKMTNHST